MFGVHQQAGQCAGADLAQVLKFDAGRDEFIARGRVIQQSQPRTRRALRAATFAKRGERVAYLQIDAVDDTACGGFEKAKTNLRIVLPIAAVVRREDRKSVVSGTSVSVRVDLGGRRIIKKKQSPHDQLKKSNRANN